MTNPSDNKNYREVRQESYTDKDGNAHTDVTKTSETVDNSAANYQSGYVQGRASERNYEEALAQRDDENTSRGLLIGVVLAGLAALIGSAFWYFNQSSQTVDNTVAPATSAPIYSPSPSPVVTQTAQPQQTTIIERTKEVPVKVPVEKTKEVPVFIPVPQQAAPAPAPANTKPAAAPNINITVPPQPAAKTPATQVSPAPSSSSSNSSPSTTSTTSQSGESIAPSQENQDKADVTTDGSATTEKSN